MPLSEKLWKENYLYISDKPIDQLRSDIESLLERTRGFRFETNLTGSFCDLNTFQMTPKWFLGNIKGFGDRDISHLYGELLQQGAKTLVRVTVRPNIGMVVAVFLAPAAVLAMLATGSISWQNTIIAVIMAVLAPLWFYYLAIRYPKNAIRKRFARLFDLRLTTHEHVDLPDTNP